MGLFVDETDADAILTAVLEKLQKDAGETLYPGDERRMFGESVGALLVIAFNAMDATAKSSLLMYAIGEALDAIGSSYDCERMQANQAVTTLRFSLAEEYPSSITIPAGTRVTTEGGLYFATDVDAVIEEDELYVDVTATAMEGGTQYNGLLPGTITQMVDLIAYVDFVTNTETTAGGTDEEEDDEYRERIRLKLSSFSTAGSANAYKYWALSADSSIADAYIDSPTANVINIYIVTDEGELPTTALIARVQAVVNADDVRPLGDLVTTLAPTENEYDIELEYYVSSGKEAAVVEAVESLEYVDEDGNTQVGAIEKYRLWQDTAIARDINPDYLKKLILDAGASRVEITSPEYTVLTGANVAHFSGTKTISHTVYDDE